MSRLLQIHMDSAEAMGERFIQAWHRLEREPSPSHAETHLTLFSLDAMMQVLTPTRLTLLRYLRGHPKSTLDPLPLALAEQAETIQTDLAALQQAGLIEQAESGGIIVPYDELRTTVSLTL